MEGLLANDRWHEIKNLRQERRARQGRLWDMDGQLVESDQWGDTMAQHLERVQWRVRPVGLADGSPSGEPLDVSLASLTIGEIREAVRN